MALSAFQREICQLVARNRLQNGESYLAGAAALNELLGAPRLSRDLDVFHDTEEALRESRAFIASPSVCTSSCSGDPPRGIPPSRR